MKRIPSLLAALLIAAACGGRELSWKRESDDALARRTMADMRLIATAWEARATDMNKYNAAAATMPRLASTVPEDELASALTPTYLKAMPRMDGWGHPFQLRADQPMGSKEQAVQYLIASRGKDDALEANPAGGPVTDFDCDILYSNGTFLQYPASLQQQ